MMNVVSITYLFSEEDTVERYQGVAGMKTVYYGSGILTEHADHEGKRILNWQPRANAKMVQLCLESTLRENVGTPQIPD
jgi:hypothetical protein